MVGGALFALLTLLELDRVHRSRTDQLLDAILSPLTAALIRLWALLCLSLMVLMAMLLVWLPYTRHAAGAVFDGETYVLAYLIFFFPALPLSVLAAAAAYQFTRRFDLSAVLYLAFAALSLSVWSTHWQLCWLNPSVWAISDDFSNDRIFRSVAYMRLTWLLALAGLWGLSYLCIRRYGRGAIGSLRTAPGGSTGRCWPLCCWPPPPQPMPANPFSTTAIRLWRAMATMVRSTWMASPVPSAPVLCGPTPNTVLSMAQLSLCCKTPPDRTNSFCSPFFPAIRLPPSGPWPGGSLLPRHPGGAKHRPAHHLCTG